MASMLLLACGQTDLESLRSGLEQKRSNSAPKASQHHPEAVFKAANFVSNGVDPFDPQRLVRALQDSQKHMGAQYAIENKRPRQFLEKYPLETFAFVGNMKREGKQVALVRVENAVHSVGLGAYLGMHSGKVVRISDEELHLRELVQDSLGQWAERTQILQLQGKIP